MDNPDKVYDKPFGGGLWWANRTGATDGATMIMFLPPDKYQRFGHDEIHDLPESGYEYRIVQTGTCGGSI